MEELGGGHSKREAGCKVKKTLKATGWWKSQMLANDPRER